MPQSQVRDQDKNGVLLVLTEFRLQLVDLENTVVYRDLEAQKCIQDTGLQISPMLLCLHFFSNLITQMLNCVIITPALKKEWGL